MPPVKPEALRKKARRLQAERAATEREKAKIEAELQAVRNRIKVLRALGRFIEAQRRRNAADQG